ncbi:MAG: DUF5662 family protein [Acidobacteriales bacterium]|nr:DUF5662 family protein [Terriglobales bacterium]
MNFPPRFTAESVAADFNKAWLLHQHRNPHHWQFWILQEDDGGYEKLPMPYRYRCEMLADWRGAGLAITGEDNTPEWYRKNRDNMRLHPCVRAWIEEQLGVSA